MLASTLPLGPTVRRCSCSSTVPTTSPSMVKSSRLKIWPLTMTDLPNTADPPRGLSKWGSLIRPGSVDMGIPSFASADEVGGAEAGFSASSSSLRRFHMGIASLHQRNVGASPSPRERTQATFFILLRRWREAEAVGVEHRFQRQYSHQLTHIGPAHHRQDAQLAGSHAVESDGQAVVGMEVRKFGVGRAVKEVGQRASFEENALHPGTIGNPPQPLFVGNNDGPRVI